MNGINETTTTTGTGDLTLAAVTGRPRFSDFFAANASEASADLFPYCIMTRDTPPKIVEWGKGWLSATSTLVRQEILGTYSGTTLNILTPTAISLPAATHDVIFGPLADYTMGAMHNIDSTSSGIVKGKWATINSISGSAGASTAKDRCYYQPLYLDAARVVAGAMLALSGNASGAGKTRVGLYQANRNGYPGRKLIETGDIDCTTGSGTIKTAAWAGGATIRLQPGWYFLAVASNYATTQPSLYQGANSVTPLILGPFGLLGSNPQYSPVVTRYEGLAAGSWTDLPANANSTTTAIQLGTNPFLFGVYYA